MESCITTKSPGKCLICGGYLILSEKNSGIVFNVDAFIECSSKYEQYTYDSNSQNEIVISAYSTYNQITYTYSLSLMDHELQLSLQSPKENNNVWIYYSIKTAFYLFFLYHKEKSIKEYIETLRERKKKIMINIKGDHRFYSYKDSKESDNSIKTGLGSSSALISSITSNMMLLLYGKENIKVNSINEIDNNELKCLIVLSSLLANNFAQNKIGSGFDIISSLLGSQVFHKYNNTLSFIHPFLFDEDNQKVLNNFIDEYNSKYLSLIKYMKDTSLIQNTKLQIRLISIECGSDTRIFVKKVTEYAKANMTTYLFDDKLFYQLNTINQSLISLFLSNDFSSLLLPKIKEHCLSYRNLLQQISTATKVDIEPSILSPLLDSLISKENILFAICPGAGGYDSIVVLGTEEDNFNKEVNDCVESFNSSHSNIKAYIISANIFNKGTLIE